MRSSEPIPFSIGDRVRLKKVHPCGSFDWTVVRLGADIGLTCDTCGRRVLLPRRDLERRLKMFLPRVDNDGQSETPNVDTPASPHSDSRAS